MDKVECEVYGLTPTQVPGSNFALILKEVYGNRKMAIIIGPYEAQAISLALEGSQPPRPMAHDLMKSLIENLSAGVLEVVITELKNSTYYARIVLELSAVTNDVDARPSDAIALALRTNSPIYVDEKVIAEAAILSPEQPDKLEEEDDEEIFDAEESSKPQESKITALQAKLREALDVEDYERAAKIRDEINRLGQSS